MSRSLSVTCRKRCEKGTASRKANSTWTPGRATRSSCSSWSRFRLSRCFSVSSDIASRDLPGSAAGRGHRMRPQVRAGLLDQRADLRQRLVRAGVLPPPRDEAVRELAPLEVGAVDVGDLELAPLGGLELADDVVDRRVVGVQPDDGVAR